MGIAYAIAQQLLERNGSHVLFATHLSELAGYLSGDKVAHWCTDVKTDSVRCYYMRKSVLYISTFVI